MNLLAKDPLVRRIEGISLAFLLIGVLTMFLTRGLQAVLVLTLLGSLSIVNFRALQLQVSLLEPSSSGVLNPASRLLLLMRLIFVSGLALGILLVGSEELAAVVLGFSILPMAMTLEAVLRALGLSGFSEAELGNREDPSEADDRVRE